MLPHSQSFPETATIGYSVNVCGAPVTNPYIELSSSVAQAFRMDYVCATHDEKIGGRAA
jgi:hypothetical protein